jgi:SPP1 gp7 family putative phage head morphogenesis protein
VVASNPLATYYRRIALSILRKRGRLPRPPPVRQPVQIQRDYFRELVERADFAHVLVRARVLPELEAAIKRVRSRKDEARAEIRTDDIGLDIEKLIEQVRVIFQRRYSDAESAALAAKYADRAKGFTQEQIQAQFRKVLGVDAFGANSLLEDLLKIATKENVALITSIPERHFEEIERIAYDAVRRGLATQDLADMLEARYQVTKSRAQFIAIDQANKMTGAFTEIQHRALGLTGYIWRTTGDARVRDTHEDLDGTRQSWDDPPVVSPDGRQGHPGFDYRCRCQAEPDFYTLAGEGPELDEFRAALAEDSADWFLGTVARYRAPSFHSAGCVHAH